MISPDFLGFLRISPGAPGAPDFSDFFGFLRISPDFTGFFPDFSGFVEIFLISPGARGNNIANSVYLFKFLAIFMDFRGCLHRPGTKKPQAGHTASGGEVASQAISRTSMGSNPAPAPHEGRKTTKSTDGTPEELNSKGNRDPVEMNLIRRGGREVYGRGTDRGTHKSGCRIDCGRS